MTFAGSVGYSAVTGKTGGDCPTATRNTLWVPALPPSVLPRDWRGMGHATHSCPPRGFPRRHPCAARGTLEGGGADVCSGRDANRHPLHPTQTAPCGAAAEMLLSRRLQRGDIVPPAYDVHPLRAVERGIARQRRMRRVPSRFIPSCASRRERRRAVTADLDAMTRRQVRGRVERCLPLKAGTILGQTPPPMLRYARRRHRSQTAHSFPQRGECVSALALPLAERKLGTT